MPGHRHALVIKKQQIENNLIGLFAAVIDAMDQAVSCLAGGDKAICKTIIEHDVEINNTRYLVEEECLTAIALHQLVADDLQGVVAATRIAGELERIGDYASDIASIIMQMTGTDLSDVGIADLLKISSLCANMMDEILAAYREKNAERAIMAAKIDDEIDAEHAKLIEKLFSTMQSRPDFVPDASRMLWISHILERYGDHLTNIAEQVVFITEARVIELG